MYKSVFITLFLSCFSFSLLIAQIIAPWGASDPNDPTTHDYVCSHQQQEIKIYANSNSTEFACPNDFEEWSNLDNTEFIEALTENYDYDCFRALFSYESAFGASLFSKEKIDLTITELNQRALNYTGQDDSGMYGILIYLHTVLFHDFYQSDINLEVTSQELLKGALKNLASNQGLWTISKDPMNVLYEFYIVCDFKGFRHDPILFGTLKTGLNQMITVKAWKPIENSTELYYFDKAYNQLYATLFRGVQNNDEDFIAALDTDPNDELINLIKDFISDQEITDEQIFPRGQLNAFNELVRMCSKTQLEDNVESAFAAIANSHERLSYFWYKSINILVTKGKCALYNLCEDLILLEEEVRAVLFPNTWIFDDGNMEIRTAIDYDIAQELYYASKQVQAQFFRIMDSDEALVDDPTEKLNMIIYGTRQEYREWQYELYGLNTNNGGIYIERDASFYTYQRTPAESIYTLEELFRHEYVHYLEGRYLDPGFWGETQFYNNEEITWLNEGLAEYLAGSTDLDGVKLRNSVAGQLDNDNQAITVENIVKAKYSQGFNFYRYANAFVMYMMTHERPRFEDLLNSLKNDDLTAYINQIDAIKVDVQLQTDFDDFLSDILSDPTAWWAVETYYEDWENLDLSTIEEIETAINGQTALQNIEVSITAENSIRRFSATATLPSGDKDASTDLVLNNLQNSSYDNFGFVTGYYKTTSNDNKIVISGSLASEPSNTIDQEPNHFLQLSPNPTVHSITIVSELNLFQYEILDLTGRSLMIGSSHTKELKLDLANLESGVYLIRVNQNQEILSAIIIKQ